MVGVFPLKALEFAMPSSMLLIRPLLTPCYLSTFAAELTGSHIRTLQYFFDASHKSRNLQKHCQKDCMLKADWPL